MSAYGLQLEECTISTPYITTSGKTNFIKNTTTPDE